MKREFKYCPRCGAPLKKANAVNNTESEFWYTCTNFSCNTYVNSYVPQPHQAKVHLDNRKFLGNFGGYGSGKTTTSRMEWYKHLFLTPNGTSLIGANIAAQYEQTIKREIESDIPAEFVAHVNTQKQHIDFINGHRLMFRPFDDPDKLRSLNLSMFVIVEGSECKPDVFSQLKTRLRNMTAGRQELDEEGNPIMVDMGNGVLVPKMQAIWLKGIIESNPDSGWIRSEFLLLSKFISYHGLVADTYDIPAHLQNDTYSTHITATEANLYLPPNFREDLAKSKPLWWVRRYLEGSFKYSEGLVYPSAMNCLVDDFAIPSHWRRLLAFDYGLADDAVYILGAVSPDGELYIYDEVRTRNRDISELAEMFKNATSDVPVGGWYSQPVIDPKNAAKRDYTKKTLYDHFLEYGIAFKPGYIDVDARVFRTNTYLESGKVKIFKHACRDVIEELRDYKFAREKNGEMYTDKPEDKRNHGVNALEWIVMELPSDPKNMLFGAYNGAGVRLDNKKEYDPEYLYRSLVLTAESNEQGGTEWNY